MIGRILLAVILSGIAAGLVMGLIQHVRLTPLILQAETYEHVAHGHGAETHSHGEDAWSPGNGLERTVYTTLTAVITAVGFALLIVGLSFVGRIPLTRSNAWIWGSCGFAAVSLAPATSLPPALPGMFSTEALGHQLWWLFCVVLTGFGLWLLIFARDNWWRLAGVANILAPHVFAPTMLPNTQSKVPASLASTFASNSLGANLVMWLVIAITLGYALQKFEGTIDT